jgi:NDP-sugar pyrophosphorylase family protein
MQALILAAGFGKRLQPITNNIHKSLVEVNGTPLLLNALDCLSDRNITEVILVIGDKKEQIIEKVGHYYNKMKITYIENPVYQTTNNVYSFWLAKNYINDDLLMLECDLFYRKELIDKILQESDASCSLLVSKYNSDTMNGTVVTTDKNNTVLSLVIKRNQKENFDYSDAAKTVNIYFFKKPFIVGKFLPTIETYIETQSDNSYYELVLGSLIYYGNDDIRAIYVDESEWCEIDDTDDLKKANLLFKTR